MKKRYKIYSAFNIAIILLLSSTVFAQSTIVSDITISNSYKTLSTDKPQQIDHYLKQKKYPCTSKLSNCKDNTFIVNHGIRDVTCADKDDGGIKDSETSDPRVNRVVGIVLFCILVYFIVAHFSK
jgi:hypothetical protein